MDADKQRKFGRRVVRMSPPLLLVCLATIIVGGFYRPLPIGSAVALFLLGFPLARPLLLFYKTGNPKYAAMYGCSFGLGFTFIFYLSPPAGPNWAVVLYGVACCMGAIFLLFFLFRRRFLKFIGEARA